MCENRVSDFYDNGLRARVVYNSWKNTAYDYCNKVLKKRYGDDKNNEKIWNIIKENYIEELIDGECEENYVKLIDFDGRVLKGYFREYFGDEFFEVLDKSIIGEEIGKEIYDKLNDGELFRGLSKEEIYEKNGNYTSEFFGEVLTEIEEYITNEIRNEICVYVFEYLDNNLE